MIVLFCLVDLVVTRHNKTRKMLGYFQGTESGFSCVYRPLKTVQYMALFIEVNYDQKVHVKSLIIPVLQKAYHLPSLPTDVF